MKCRSLTVSCFGLSCLLLLASCGLTEPFGGTMKVPPRNELQKAQDRLNGAAVHATQNHTTGAALEKKIITIAGNVDALVKLGRPATPAEIAAKIQAPLADVKTDMHQHVADLADHVKELGGVVNDTKAAAAAVAKTEKKQDDTIAELKKEDPLKKWIYGFGGLLGLAGIAAIVMAFVPSPGLQTPRNLIVGSILILAAGAVIAVAVNFDEIISVCWKVFAVVAIAGLAWAVWEWRNKHNIATDLAKGVNTLTDDAQAALAKLHAPNTAAFVAAVRAKFAAATTTV
jgi:hypothetical protein